MFGHPRAPAFRYAALIAAALAGAATTATHADDRLHPTLTLVDVDGRPHGLADLRGKIVLLNFWATWCRPCREEMPLLERLHREFGAEGAAGVEFIGASTDAESTRSRIPAAIEESGITFDVWVGAATPDMERFEIGTGLPATAILDRDGSVAFRILGPVDEDLLRDRIGWLLGPRTTTAPAARVDTFAAGGGHDDDDEHADADSHDDHGHVDEHEHDHHHEHGHDHAHDHGDGAVSGADASLVPS
ncbi:MAG: TlpA family protein disulfide reductase [Myxococcales bacterium]|nr:MAG: TlpA family protein disulfide reductase [Myxococcales bacterium]